MTLKVESVVDHGMHAEEALGRSSRFEPLHLSLSSSHRLMGIATAPRLKRSASTGPLAHQRLTEDLPCSPSVLYPLMPISGGARGCGDGARFAAKSLAKQVGDIKSHDVIVNESHAVVNRLPIPWITTVSYGNSLAMAICRSPFKHGQKRLPRAGAGLQANGGIIGFLRIILFGRRVPPQRPVRQRKGL